MVEPSDDELDGNEGIDGNSDRDEGIDVNGNGDSD
jgi:hypothetical protein